jgi:hypothetical protein
MTIDPVKETMDTETDLATWHVTDTDVDTPCHITSETTQHLADLQQKGRTTASHAEYFNTGLCDCH